MLARRVIPLALLVALAAPATVHAAVATPLNYMLGKPTKATILSCTNNERHATFSASGKTNQGLVGTWQAQGSASFGPPDENGFGAVTAFNMTFTVTGRAGQVLNGHASGGSPQQSSTDEGACGQDVDFGYSLFIDTSSLTWSADVKSRFGTYHDHGDAGARLNVYGTTGVDGYMPNLSSSPTGRPVNVNPPTITGTPNVGRALTCHAGDWIGSVGVSKYEWLRDGTVAATHYGGIEKTTDAYTVQPADATHRMACRVTVDRGFGLDAVTRTSNAALVGGCLVPNVHGKGLAKAKSALTAANCALGAVTRRKGKGVPFGHVLSQKPGAGATGPKGLKVAVVLRKKPG